MAASERIGIRELRQHASRWVRRAEEGHRIEITNHGRLVAVLAPVTHEDDPLTAMERSGRVDDLLGRCDVVRLDRQVLVAAGRLSHAALGSLDAIHLATALQLGDHLATFVTHDLVLGRAATAHDLAVATPA